MLVLHSYLDTVEEITKIGVASDEERLDLLSSDYM